MRDITKLNIKYIDDNGRYTDYNKRLFLRLTDEEIIEIRRYNHNRLIAKNRVRTKMAGQKVNIYNEEILRKKVRLHSHKKKRRITKRWLKRNAKALVLRALVGVTIAGGVIGGIKGINTIKTNNRFAYEANKTAGEDVDYDEATISFEDILDREQQRDVMIRKYCNIFQIDYDITHDLLAKLTENFTSDDYFEGRIPGIYCKGAGVQADSEEELLIYAIRNIKQVPEQFHLSKEKLYIDNGYTSSNDYFGQIKYYADLFGINECLVAAIVQSETGFDSHLFNTINNPAGLKLNDDWWGFANKEEGFIELCLEIIKDYRIIGYPKDVVNEEVIRGIGSIHAPDEDNNEFWIPNVISNYNKYKNNYEEYFSTADKTNIRTI